jgi:hypothetical protein
MSSKKLKELYKAKPELVEEHKRLVNVLRSGSPSEQKKEAAKQLKELKEMLKKEELEKRCWEGYKPVPGKKPYEKGSCEPVSKEETLKVEKNGQWSLGKSNSVKPFGENIYDEKANIKRKQNRTGEEATGVGPNVAVQRFTGVQGTAKEQASRQASQDKKKNKKQPVKIVDFSAMTPENREKASKLIAQGVDPSVIEGVKFNIKQSSKKSKEGT